MRARRNRTPRVPRTLGSLVLAALVVVMSRAESSQPHSAGSGTLQRPFQFVHLRKMGADTRVICDGRDLGPGFDVALTTEHIAFTRRVALDGRGVARHVIYDGRDLGIGNNPTVLDDHLAFQRGVDAQGQPSEFGASHVVFDGKDLGPGATPRLLPGGHIVFHRGNGWPPRVIYDGNDLGPREQSDRATPGLHASLVVAEQEILSTRVVGGRMHIIRHGQDIGEGDNPVVSGPHLAFVRVTGSQPHVVFNGRELGPGMNPVLEGEHLAFVRINPAAATIAKQPTQLADLISFARTAFHVFYDGRNLGEGNDPVLSGDHVVFLRQVGDRPHVIYDGRDMGEGQAPCISGDHLAYEVMRAGETHIVLDGRDLGPGLSPQFAAAPHRESGSVLRN